MVGFIGRNTSRYSFALLCFLAVSLSVLSVQAQTQAGVVSPSLSRFSLDSNWHQGAYQSQGVALAQQGDWVKNIPLVEPKTEPSDKLSDGVFYLIIDNQFQVLENKPPSEFNHYAIKAISAKGLEVVSQVSVEFDPTYENIIFHGITVHRNGVALDKTLDTQFSLDKTESSGDLLYDGTLKALWMINDIRIGDIVEYRYTRQGQNPVFKNIFSGSRTLQWSVPVHQQFTRILWGKTNPLHFKMFNTEQGVTQTRLGNQIDYQLSLNNHPTKTLSNDAANWYDPYVRVEFSESANWQGVVNWAVPLFEGQTDSSAQLTAKLAEITQQSSDIKQQVSSALKFVQQDIRYLGIEVGSNSHFPAKASETLLNRYGDCKDKSVLLIAILNGLGVNASPVLVNSQVGESLHEMLAGPTRFNHAIVKAHIEGKDYWLDPTLLYQKEALDNLYQPNYGYALVIKDGVDALEKMPSKNSGSRITFSENYDFTEGAQTSGQFTSTVTYQGNEARVMRSKLVSTGVQGLAEQYASFYDKLYNGISINTPLSTSEDTVADSLSIHEDYQLTAPWLKDDDGGYTVYLNESQVSPYLEIPNGYKKRALTLSYPFKIDGEIKIHLRKINWTFTNEELIEDNPFFKLVYKVQFNKKTNQLTLSYEYQTKTDRVQAEEVTAYISALKKVADVSSYGMVDYPDGKVATTDDATKEAKQVEYYTMWGMGFLLIILLVAYIIIDLSIETQTSNDAVFYPVSMTKFSILTVFSMGLYTCYWSYKNWQYIKLTHNRPDIWPIARAFFAPLWLYALYSWLEIDSEQRGQRKSLVSSGLAMLIFISYLGWNAVSSKVDLNVLDYTAPFIAFAAFVYYINKINGKTSLAYIANSKWHIRNIIFVMILTPVVAFPILQNVGLLANDKVIEGDKLWSHHITFMREHKVLDAQETPILFYSADVFNNQDDGNGFTDTKVFSYWDEDGDILVSSALFSTIKDIKIKHAKPAKDETVSEVTIVQDDDSEFLIYVTATDGQDKAFIKRLMAQWRLMKPSESAAE